jgi:hypothetical protein
MSIHWNVALCNLIPAGAPFMNAGMSSICPLRSVTVFVLQLTSRRNPSVPPIYLPLSYDLSQNSLDVFIPPRMGATASSTLPHLIGIDRQLKQFCERFRQSGNNACVIVPAIRQMLTMPNLLMLH